jgi:hypothetical protein
MAELQVEAAELGEFIVPFATGLSVFMLVELLVHG